MTLQLQKDTKKMKEEMARKPALRKLLQFFKDGIKMTATDTKYYQTEN